MKDVEFIKEESRKHKAHGYRWLSAFLRKNLGVNMSPEYVYRCRKYAGIMCESKHYKWKKPGDNNYIYENLIWNNWNASKPLELIVSDMTSFYSRGIYYELTLYFDTFNREIIGFGLTDRKGDIKPYFEGLEQVINLIKEKEQTTLSTLHTDQGSVYSSETINNAFFVSSSILFLLFFNPPPHWAFPIEFHYDKNAEGDGNGSLECGKSRVEGIGKLVRDDVVARPKDACSWHQGENSADEEHRDRTFASR